MSRISYPALFLVILIWSFGWTDCRNLAPFKPQLTHRTRPVINLMGGRSRNGISTGGCESGRCLFNWGFGGGGYGDGGYGDGGYGDGGDYYYEHQPPPPPLEYCQEYYDPYYDEIWEDCVPY